ncbi:hypothetical protein IWQ60_005229 [Tieghemiomyces parasiticus]|uniref:Rhodanese domain-containing protein n=1 Tax=Tieghemiomyces parasiticus TaxID=78921 RepID=A0A9W8DYM7_9FUNG|nr:hypothetical protein IWQ60_005229 [Tieghemiomyces parasiticus]
MDDDHRFTRRRAAKLASDAVAFSCDCPSGRVILFYHYLSAARRATLAAAGPSHNNGWVYRMAEEQETLARRWGLTGKIRVAPEGLNITLGGTDAAITRYVGYMVQHPWLAPEKAETGPQLYPLRDVNDPDDAESLPIPPLTPPFRTEAERRRHLFFKPSPGCAHVFDTLSVKVVPELCPLGRPDLAARDINDRQHRLDPPAFHRALQEARTATHAKPGSPETIVLDARNYYESRIGHFADAVCPPLRKFSALPEYLRERREELRGKRVLTYCTGGVRCEKLTSFITQDLFDKGEEGVAGVWMLDGGIHNYLDWARTLSETTPSEVTSLPPNSLFLGVNYVFDARQSLALPSAIPVASCQRCRAPVDRYLKCNGRGCHLLLLLCDRCRRLKSVEVSAGRQSTNVPRPVTAEVSLSDDPDGTSLAHYCCPECYAYHIAPPDRRPPKRSLCLCERRRHERARHSSLTPSSPDEAAATWA